jgi:hypothetical protein
MTWTLQLTGHTADREDEQKVLDDIKEFLTDFGPRSGLLSGQFSGMFVQESLTPPAEAQEGS